jgi:hypothetical protein
MPSRRSGRHEKGKVFISKGRGGNGENRKELGPDISGLNIWRALTILRKKGKATNS